MSKNPTEKLFNYITLLEDANEQLVRILKMSTKLLEQCKPVVPDPETWQDMIVNYRAHLVCRTYCSVFF